MPQTNMTPEDGASAAYTNVRDMLRRLQRKRRLFMGRPGEVPSWVTSVDKFIDFFHAEVESMDDNARNRKGGLGVKRATAYPVKPVKLDKERKKRTKWPNRLK